jgi:hypothetical protein
VSLSGDYNLVDRCLHYIAFGHPAIQKALCEIENDLYGGRFKSVVTRNEVFVTGLPRSGTTLVLDLLYRTGEFSTFTYRNMPFVLAPILWSKLSHSFHRQASEKERAHGDGMQMSFDSPEAFEEVIWLAWLGKKIVRPACLSPLSADACDEDFTQAIKTTIRKLLYLDRRTSTEVAETRYLSKNNANISRIGALAKLFPDAVIVVPFRQPLAHAGSLMNQHERFLREHSADRFAERYMKWLGHYEFGNNFKPINFDNWLGGRDTPYRVDADFWLAYWIKAYEYVLANKTGNLVLLDFDDLVRRGERVLSALAERLHLHDRHKLMEQADRLRSPTSEPLVADMCSAQLRRAADEVHTQLKTLALEPVS